jgi:uncharacterized protein (TIGR03067 family)
MRPTLGVIVLLAAGLGLAAQDKKEGKKAVKLEGTYLIVGIEMGGERIPDEFLGKAPEEERTVKITADKLISAKKGKDDSISYKIDASKSPAHITTTENKDGKVETSYGIYKLDGDTLTICMIESGKPEDRPKDFKSAKNSRSVLLVLKKK